MSDPFAPESNPIAEQPAPDATALDASPPLGIRHLLLWMTCSAILLTVYQAITSVLATAIIFDPESRLYWNLVQAYYAIVLSPAVVALGIWLLRGRKEWDFPLHPGEWLLLALGSITILDLLNDLFVTYSYTHNHGNLIVSNYFRLLKVLTIAICLSLIAFLNPFPKWWRLAILCYAGLWARFSNNQIFEMFPMLLKYFRWMPDPTFTYSTIPFTVLLVCLGIDRYKHVTHTWLHYAGSILVASDLLGIIMFTNCKSLFR